MRIAMIAITTNSSMSVKALRPRSPACESTPGAVRARNGIEGARNMAVPLREGWMKVGGPFRGRAHGAGDGRGEFSSGVPDTRSAEVRDSREALAADQRVEDPAGAHGQAGVREVVETRHAVRRAGRVNI